MDLKANLSIGDEGEVGEDWHKEDLRMGKEGPTDATVAASNHADEETWQEYCGRYRQGIASINSCHRMSPCLACKRLITTRSKEDSKREPLAEKG